MRRYLFGIQRVRHAVSALLLCAAHPMHAGEINVTRTNMVERWITNLIEVRMPANHFVNEYHTNWITQMRTNIVDIYSTNVVTLTLTNPITVDTFQTNIFSEYHTNSQTINLTNWQNVVLIKTNWTVQSVTTVAEVTMPANSPAATETHAAPSTSAATPPAAKPQAAVELAAPAATSLTIDGLVIEASRAARPTINGQIEVTLKAHNAATPASPLQIQQWRVERDDGAILVFGQDSEFKRDLPIGRYKIELKLQHNADAAVIPTRAVLAVTPTEALLQPRMTAKR